MYRWEGWCCCCWKWNWKGDGRDEDEVDLQSWRRLDEVARRLLSENDVQGKFPSLDDDERLLGLRDGDGGGRVDLGGEGRIDRLILLLRREWSFPKSTNRCW